MMYAIAALVILPPLVGWLYGRNDTLPPPYLR